MTTRVRTPPMKEGAAKDFSGGPNIRDAATELQQNECVDAFNVTFDERGGVASRLGYAKFNSSAFGSAVTVNTFWSKTVGVLVTQTGTKLYLGTSTSSVKTFTTSERVTFAELATFVIACHPTDGLFTSTDCTTWTAVADADAPKGTCLAVWQNKLFVGGIADAKVQWSNIGDPTAWTATDFNKLREIDSQVVVALHVGSGQDILGRPGLLAFKRESTYRLNDASTGAYETVDATVGCASAVAVTGVGSKVIAISKRGIFWWQEGLQGMQNASDRFLPLWDPVTPQVNLAQIDLWCAGRKGNRAVFSLTRAGSTANDLSIEFHPEQDWLAPGSNAMSCYATSAGTVEATYGGHPTTVGQVYQLDSGGTDDGTAITGLFQTRWFELSGGFLASVWQIRLQGRGTGNIAVRTDYASGGGTTQPFDLSGSTTVTYDSGLHYDSGVAYYVPAFQTTEPLFSIGVCRQMSLRFTFTVSSTATGQQVLGTGTAPTVGAFGLYGLEWLYAQLGLA